MALTVSIQRGSRIIQQSDLNTITVTLPTAIVIANSIVMYTQESGSTQIRNARFAFRVSITGTTEITFNRRYEHTARDTTVFWTVIEFEPTAIIRIQQGFFSASATQTFVTLSPAVVAANCTIVHSYQTDLMGLDFPRAQYCEVISTTQAEWRSTVGVIAGQFDVDYFVIEWDPAAVQSVQNGRLLFSNDTSLTFAINSVDVSKTAIFLQGSQWGNSVGNSHMRVELTSDVLVTVYAPVGVSQTGETSFSVVEFKDEVVQSGNIAFLGTDASKNVTFPELGSEYAVVNAMNFNNINFDGDSFEDTDHRFSQDVGLPPDDLTVARVRAGSIPADLSYFIIDFTASGPIVVPIGLVTEVDLSQVIDVPQNRLIGQSLEADIAQIVASQTGVVLGQPSEIDFAQPMVPQKSLMMGTALETCVSQPLTPLKAKDIAQVQEANAVMGLNRAKSVAVGSIVETDLSNPISVDRGYPVGQATELDQALAVAIERLYNLGSVLEVDTAQQVQPLGDKIIAVNPANETDVAQALGKLKEKAIGLVNETGVAQQVAHAFSKILGLPSELDTAQSVIKTGAVTLGLVLESDFARDIKPVSIFHLGTALELNAALPVETRLAVLIGIATETDMAQGVQMELIRLIGLAQELDMAFTVVPIGGSTLFVFARLDETASSNLVDSITSSIIAGSITDSE